MSIASKDLFVVVSIVVPVLGGLIFEYMNKEQLIKKYGLEWYEQFKASRREYYHNNPKYRKSVIENTKERYHNNPKYRESLMERKKERYHNDPEFWKYTREYTNACNNKRYQSDPEFKEAAKIRSKARYVENKRIDLIENYELAVNDGIENWDIHHRLELHPDGSIRFTKQSLIKLDLYYNRPPTELIWIKRSEHIQMHNKSRGLK